MFGVLSLLQIILNGMASLGLHCYKRLFVQYPYTWLGKALLFTMILIFRPPKNRSSLLLQEQGEGEKDFICLNRLIYFPFPLKDWWIGKGIEGSPFPFSLSIDKYPSLSPTFPQPHQPELNDTGQCSFSETEEDLSPKVSAKFWRHLSLHSDVAHILPEIPKAALRRISHFFNIHPTLNSMKNCRSNVEYQVVEKKLHLLI